MNSRFNVHDCGENLYKFENIYKGKTKDILKSTRREDNVRSLQALFETI